VKKESKQQQQQRQPGKLFSFQILGIYAQPRKKDFTVLWPWRKKSDEIKNTVKLHKNTLLFL
jgi:hypothetical protein